MNIRKIAQYIERVTEYAESRLSLYSNYTNLDQLYEIFSVKPAHEHQRSTKEVLDVVEQRLRRRIKSIDAIEFLEVIDELKKYYLYRHVKLGDDVCRIWNYISRFGEYIRPNQEDAHNKGNRISDFTLTRITMLIVWVTRLGPDIDYFDLSKRLSPELWRYTETVLYIENHVAEGCIEHGILQNRDEVAAILFSRVESRIRRYGTVRFLDYMLSEYKNTFDQTTKMFAPTQKLTRKFLYHLALKMATISDIPSGTGYPETIRAIENISIVLLNLYDFRIDKHSFMIISNEIVAMAIEYLKSPGALPRLRCEELCKRLRKRVRRDTVITYLKIQYQAPKH